MCKLEAFDHFVCLVCLVCFLFSNVSCVRLDEKKIVLCTQIVPGLRKIHCAYKILEKMVTSAFPSRFSFPEFEQLRKCTRKMSKNSKLIGVPGLLIKIQAKCHIFSKNGSLDEFERCVCVSVIHTIRTPHANGRTRIFPNNPELYICLSYFC